MAAVARPAVLLARRPSAEGASDARPGGVPPAIVLDVVFDSGVGSLGPSGREEGGLDHHVDHYVTCAEVLWRSRRPRRYSDALCNCHSLGSRPPTATEEQRAGFDSVFKPSRRSLSTSEVPSGVVRPMPGPSFFSRRDAVYAVSPSGLFPAALVLP